MPSLANVLKRFTKQTMVYWPKTGSDGYGKPVYGDPVLVAVRWEDKQMEVILPDNRKVMVKARLLLASPVLAGSLVMLGTLEDWQALPTYPSMPTVNQGGREVILDNATPDIKAQSFVYEAYL
jgi:hypothetical protein